MAILKIKQLIRDLQNTETNVMTGAVARATSSGEAGSAAYTGTSYTLTASQLRGQFNRITGTWGEGINCGTGIGTVGDDKSWGVRIFPVKCTINGRQGTAGTCEQINPPRSTQGAATYVKYLISTGFGSSGTITAGVEAATSTAAKLPNLPANHVPVGFIEYAAHATYPRIWYDAGNGTYAPFSGAPSSTSGTALVGGAVVGVGVSGFTQLTCMPYLE